MPLYVYTCTCCNETFEELRKLSDPPLDTHDGCPKNNEPAPSVQKQLTTAQAKFVGPDWGGWNRSDDGQSMVRQMKGKAVDNYGD